MTTERRLIIGTFVSLYFFVFVSWAGWQVFYSFNDCETQARDIERITDDQQDLVFSLWIFGDGIKDNKKAGLKHYLEKAEPRIQQAIEFYGENCQRAAHKASLSFMLKGYELYLMTKQNVYKTSEASGFDWIRKTLPIDPRFE